DGSRMTLPWHHLAHRPSGLARGPLGTAVRNGLGALVHRQLPFISSFIMAQNIGVAIAAPDFHVAIVDAVPLVDVIDHFDHPAVETKSPEPFGAAFVHIGFDLDLHGALAIATMSSLVHAW